MDSFQAAATAVVEQASEQAGGVWLVTRGEGAGQLVVCSSGEDPSLRPGEVVERLDGAAVVVPLGLPDGTVFGCLAGIATEPAAPVDPSHHLTERMATILE